MYFSGIHDEVVYIMVSINLLVVKGVDIGHFVCDVLDCNTGTWLICGNDITTNYSGYPDNVYNYLSY